MSDLISRKAAIDAVEKLDILEDMCVFEILSHIELAIGTMPSAEQWIPVRMRPMDSEEREYWEEHAGFTLTDDTPQIFACPMPDDGQRIWVQTKCGFVFDDVCNSNCDGIYLEGDGDWDDVVAWMPMNVPKPWKGEEDG